MKQRNNKIKVEEVTDLIDPTSLDLSKCKKNIGANAPSALTRRPSIIQNRSLLMKRNISSVQFGEKQKPNFTDKQQNTYFSKGYNPSKWISTQEDMEKRGWSHSPVVQYLKEKKIDKLDDKK